MLKRKTILTFFLCCLSWSLSGSEEATLKATIEAFPVAESREENGKVKPGSHIILSTTVTNSGTATSTPCKLYVRFLFPKPLDTQPNSLLYFSEEQLLPSLAPGEKVRITFEKPHQWPSLFDFIRHDWGMRQYQAVAHIDDQDYLLGTRSISFSANYYQTPAKQHPTNVPSILYTESDPKFGF